MPDGTNVPGAPGVSTEIPVRTELQTEVAPPPIEAAPPEPEAPAPAPAGEDVNLEAASAAIKAAADAETTAKTVDGVRQSAGTEITKTHIREETPHALEDRLVRAQNSNATEEPPAAEVLPEGEEGEEKPIGQPITGEPPAVAAVPPVPGAALAAEPVPVGADPQQLVVNNSPSWGDKTDLSYQIPTGPNETPKLAKSPVPTEVPYPEPEPPLPEPAPATPIPPAAEPVFEDQGENPVQAQQDLPPTAAPVVGAGGIEKQEKTPTEKVDDFLEEDFALIVKTDSSTGLADRQLFYKARDLTELQSRVRKYRESGLDDERISRIIDEEAKAIETLYGEAK